MPGAWEMDNKPSLHVCVPHCTMVTMNWALGFRQLRLPQSHMFSMTRGQPIDQARNILATKALESGAEYIMFIDSDVIIPPEAITRMMQHNLDIVSGVYYVRHDPISAAAWMKSKDDSGKYNPIIKYTENALVEVDAIGFGCVLVHRRVFEKLELPYFKWTVSDDGQTGVSEDFYFCELAKQAGFHIYLDTGVQCEHITNASVSREGLGFGGM